MRMNIMILIVGLITMLTLNSCVTASWATSGLQYDEMYVETTSDDITYWTIISYGTPYYIDNVLSYYYYRGWYYYPYIWDGYYYFRPYRYVQPRGFVFRPSFGWKPDYRFRWRDNRGNFYRHNQFDVRPFDKGIHNRVRPGAVKPNGFGGAVKPQARPNIHLNNRSSTRQTVKMPQNRPNVNQAPRNRGSFSSPSKNAGSFRISGTFRNNGNHFGGRK